MPTCRAKEEHCCYVSGKECQFLERGTVEGRVFACGLRRQLGSWAKVHSDPRYLAHVRPAWDRTGGVDCGDWPSPGVQCNACGVTG